MASSTSVVRRIPLSVLAEVDALVEQARNRWTTIKVRVETRGRLAALARREGVTDGEMLQRLVEMAATAVVEAPVAVVPAKVLPSVPGVTTGAQACSECGRPGSGKDAGPLHYPSCSRFRKG